MAPNTRHVRIHGNFPLRLGLIFQDLGRHTSLRFYLLGHHHTPIRATAEFALLQKHVPTELDGLSVARGHATIPVMLFCGHAIRFFAQPVFHHGFMLFIDLVLRHLLVLRFALST